MSERPGEFLQMGEAAELIGVSRFKISRWVKDGALAVYRSKADMRMKLVRREDVLALASPELVEGPEEKRLAA